MENTININGTSVLEELQFCPRYYGRGIVWTSMGSPFDTDPCVCCIYNCNINIRIGLPPN